MPLRSTFIALALLAVAIPASALMQIFVVGSTPWPNTPAIVVTPEYTEIVAWERAGHVYTVARNGDQIFGEDDHGPGEHPALCLIPNGALLAYAEGGTIHVERWVWDAWAPDSSVTGGGNAILSLSLSGMGGSASYEGTYLSWEESGYSVWFAERLDGPWSPSEQVRDDTGGYARPRALPALAPLGLRPRIYYVNAHNGDYALLSTDRVGGIWSGPAPVPGPAGGVDFDVDFGPEYSQHLITTLWQPDCPCNHVYYLEQTADGDWLPATELTVHVDDYDWPQSVGLGVDGEGRVHAAWYQLALGSGPDTEHLYYQVLEGGVWTDATAELGGHAGPFCNVGADSWDAASIVWCELVSGQYQVTVATAAPIGAVETSPSAGFGLGVSPNPFNPRTTFALRLDAPAQVALGIYDAAGRRVRALELALPAGTSTVDWDGRDDAGRRLASGVYLARAAAGAETASARVVLLK
ncbi:hypothetical protein KDL67_13910 [bacterium]|nr:hypothetical protein [bacterium]